MTLDLYLIMIADNLRQIILCTALFSIASMVAYIASIAGSDLDGDEKKEHEAKQMKKVRQWIAVLISCTVLLMFVPSTKRCLVIYGLPKILKNKVVIDKLKEYDTLIQNKLKDTDNGQ